MTGKERDSIGLIGMLRIMSQKTAVYYDDSLYHFVGEGTGYRYAVICYRDYTMVMSFDFMSEKIIRENVGEAGADRLFVAKDAISAYRKNH